MLSNCLVDIEKEVTRHITLANSLKERNEALSSKNVDLELKLNEREKELLEERRSVARTNQSAEKWRNRCEKLEKDMTLMKQTDEDTKNSATASNFQSSLAINLENVTLLEKKSLQRDSRTKELERRLEDLEKTNTYLIQTAEELRAADKEKIRNLMEKNQNLLEELEKTKSAASNVHNNANKSCSQCSKNVEEVESMRMANQLLENELGQCTEEIEGLKNTVARKEKEIDAKKCYIDRLESSKSINVIDENRSTNEQRVEKMATGKEKKTTGALTATVDAGNKKYIVVQVNLRIDIWKDTVKRIHIISTKNLSDLSQNVSLYHKEMFILITDIVLDPRSNANLLSICRSWKKLRPDGEIHMIAWTSSPVSLICPAEQISLLTTLNTFEHDFSNYASSFAKAISKYWPKCADQLLLPEYLNSNNQQ